MNVILYCRVSSDEQSENTSLEFQERTLRAYCNNRNCNIIFCKQEDFTAKDHDMKRPAMKEIYQYCQKHKHEINLILFLRWDRFSRSAEFGFTYKRKFVDELGISINSIETPIDFDSPDWSTLLGVYCGGAQSENNKISKRTKDGIYETLGKGRFANKAPRGYKNVRTEKNSTHIEIDETKAPIIKAMFDEVAKGVEAPSYIRKKFARKGHNIPETSFYEMLRNVFYMGKIKVPAYRGAAEYIQQGIHEAIVDEETFNKVQDVLDGKKKAVPKLTKAINPDLFLRKFITCPVCGHALTGATSRGTGGQYTYYFCCNDQKHIRVRAEEANERFALYTAGLRPNKTVMNLYNQILLDLKKEKDMKKEIFNMEKDLEKINLKIRSVEDKFIDGDLSKEQYNRIMERYSTEEANLKQQIEFMKTPNRSNLEPKLGYTISLINNIDGYMRDAPVTTKCKLISSMFPEKIEFDGKSYRTNSYNKVLDLIYQQTNELRVSRFSRWMGVEV